MKRTRLALSIVLSIALLFLVLRSVYAISLFQTVAAHMRMSGWSERSESFIMQPKEVVSFEASYLFIKLGTVRFELLGKSECHGKEAYMMRAFIDSYSGIPFVNYHAIYETCADARTLMCLSTSNDKEEGNKRVRSDYIFNYPDKRLTWEESVKGVVTKRVELPLDTTYTDGLSFFYYVREACRAADGRKEKLSIPIVSDTIRSTVNLTINERRERRRVSALDYPVEAERLSGHINFTGTFGVTGDFVGWISTDSAEVPLEAELKVILGSIVVKLKDIDRKGWDPPRAD